MGWTLTTYDQNGRTASSQSFIGSGLPSAFGGNNTVTTGTASYTYAQNSTVTTDQAGHQRATFTDGLGRLALVGEYPGSGSYSTSYSYDALDNLTGVSQSSETRTFVYDSLKRLIAATNPETFSSANPAALGCSSGNAPYANCYYYDSNGNLTKKTDNRGLGVAYSYDALNRVQSKTYFNVPLTTNYVAATYTYDQASVSYSKGRLTSATTTTGETSATNYLGYDALGRVLASSQTTNGNTYQFGYTYNFADALTSETYPSGRIVNTCMDGANRAFQVSVSQCGDASFAYASNVKYAVHGAPIQVVMGNNLWHNPVYNSRLQMSSFQDLLNNNANVTLWSGNLNWGSSNNNGNLVGATYNAGGPGYSQLLTFNQAFTYDGLNRLTAANETGGWSRSFAYDAYGNMTPSGTPAPPTVSFNGNNQIVGQQYDQAGNVLAANGNKLGYDFEGRITSEQDGQNQAVETYVFDADGKRVQKYGPSGTARIVYAYDAMGRMAAEYSTVAEAPSCITCYLSADHLGTTRLITDQNGLVVARHDFLPFGEEVQGNTFGRDSHWGSGNDSINQKFTGKERDSESGLDYFGARYYGSALGRFTSPDNGIDQDETDPQSWNLYSYVRNNPLRAVDPTGRKCVDTSNGPADDGTGGGCEAAGVQANGKIDPQVFDVDDRGNMTTVISGVTNRVLANGHTQPISERSLQDDTINFASQILPAAKGLKGVSFAAIITKQFLAKELRRHAFEAAAEGVSKFAAGSGEREIESMVQAALETTGIQGQRNVTIYTLDFGKAIGTNQAGGSATSIKVFVDNTTQKVISAYPF